MEKSSWCINYFAYLWMCFSCHVLIYAYVWLHENPALSFHIMSNNELSSVSNVISLNSWQFIVYLPRDVWWKLNFNCLRVVMRRLCARAQPSNFPFLLMLVSCLLLLSQPGAETKLEWPSCTSAEAFSFFSSFCLYRKYLRLKTFLSWFLMRERSPF